MVALAMRLSEMLYRKISYLELDFEASKFKEKSTLPHL